MFSEVEARVRRVLRWFDRCEWAIRWLRLPVHPDAGEVPGLLLVQIDGLARRHLELALADGRCPFLKSLVTREKYVLTTFYSGLPSSTPAVQGEIFYGVRCAVPSFSYRDSATGEISDLFHPDLVRRVESELSLKGEPLLSGGSSWSNIYAGGAAREDTHFCISRLDKELRPRSLISRLAEFILFPVFVIRIGLMMISELFLGVLDAAFGVAQGQHPVKEGAALIARLAAGIALRELVTIGVRIDLARGLPIIHANYIGYDDMAHRRGPGSRFARWSLRGIDRSVRSLFLAAHGSIRRDYHVWIFSDHGQESTRPFVQVFGKNIFDVIDEALREAGFPGAARTESGAASPVAENEESQKARKYSFQLAHMGPVGQLYLPSEPDDEQRTQIARALVAAGVPGVLTGLDNKLIWFDDMGRHVVEPGASIPALGGHPPELVSVLLEDLICLASHSDAGQLVLLGWGLKKPTVTFTSENGSHAGPGLDETQGFLLKPPAAGMPLRSVFRPRDLREAALSVVRGRPISGQSETEKSPAEIRILTYNVHGCSGSDGRISPRRIARILRESGADVVAIQELDRRRLRSRMEDQVLEIAVSLGFHHVFCPTVVAGEELYGHAIFSRYPLTKIKVDYLPSASLTWWKERRAALWCAVQLGNRSLNLVTTHLGLTPPERRAQVDILLGPDWIGKIPSGESVIFCGDMNFLPGGRCHRKVLRAGLRDLIPSAAKTFGASVPVVRLDHMFTSPDLVVRDVCVIRNYLTRLASDHLPISARIDFGDTGK